MEHKETMTKLNLGCGYNFNEGYINIDKNSPHADLNLDLETEEIPFNNVKEILMYDFLEHISNPLLLLANCYKILIVGGKIKIRVPHFSNYSAYNALHKTFWYSSFFERLTKNTFEGSAEQHNWFTIKKCYIHFYRLYRLLGIEWLVNLNDRTRLTYEAHLCWIFPADWLEVELVKKRNNAN